MAKVNQQVLGTQIEFPLIDFLCSYLEHILAGKRPGNTFYFIRRKGTWCGRKNKIQKLCDRGYGYIVFFPLVIIIDELYLLTSPQPYLLGAVLVSINQHQKAVRIHFHYEDSEVGRLDGHFDLFIPNYIQQSNSRLMDLVVAINQSFKKGWKKNSPQYFENFRSICENSTSSSSPVDSNQHCTISIQQPLRTDTILTRF